jgi:hypothetical protein
MNMNGPNHAPATNLRYCGATSGANHAENVVVPSATVVEPKKSHAFLSVRRIHTSSPLFFFKFYIISYVV